MDRSDALERRWRQSGAASDAARWLAERLRLGQLSSQALAWASELGDPAARLALGRDEGALPDLPRFFDILGEQHHEVLARAGLAAAGFALAARPEGPSSWSLERAREELEELILHGQAAFHPDQAPKLRLFSFLDRDLEADRIGRRAIRLTAAYESWLNCGCPEDLLEAAWRLIAAAARSLNPRDRGSDSRAAFQGRSFPGLQQAMIAAVVPLVLGIKDWS